VRGDDQLSLKVLDASFQLSQELRLPEGEQLEPIANGDDGLWVSYFVASTECSEPADLTECYNPLVHDILDLVDASPSQPPERYAQPDLWVARFSATGELLWTASGPPGEVLDFDDPAGGRVAVDGRGWSYLSQSYTKPPRTVVMAFDPDGKLQYTRELEGFGSPIADGKGLTMLFDAASNMHQDQAPADAGVEQGEANDAATTDTIALSEVKGYHGCPGIQRLDDNGEVAWGWSGLFDRAVAAGDHVLVAELDAERTRVPATRRSYVYEPVLQAIHRLDAEGHWLGAFKVPDASGQQWSADAEGNLFVGESSVEAYHLP